MHFSALEIAQICSGSLVCGSADACVDGLSWDSRTVGEGCLFLAFQGEHVDGHLFCHEALGAGAHVLLVTEQPTEKVKQAALAAGAAIVRVSSMCEALQQLARAWRSRLKGEVLTLTGSSGKTSTKNLLRDVLSCKGPTVATQGNQNNEIGVPATLLSAEEDSAFVIVEMGMRGLGQLEELCRFTQPSASLVTNVGTSHIELLGSRDAIAQAKAEPFRALQEGTGIAFINASDPFAPALREYGQLDKRNIPIVYFDGSGASPLSYAASMRPSAWAENIHYNEWGNPSFILHLLDECVPCKLQLVGAHSVHNALAAAAVGFHFGLKAAEIVHALESALPTEGRQNRVEAANGVVVIDDSYNANPDSMRASLDAFSRMEPNGRRIAVLGDMLELGNYAQEGHEQVGRKLASCKIDMLVCVGSLARFIAQAAIDSGMHTASVVCVENAEQALACVAAYVEKGDAVLVKASHSIGLDEVVKGLVK